MEEDTTERNIVNDDQPLIPQHSRQAATALALLLLYSFFMFTLPFVAFFGVKYLLQDVFDVTGFPLTLWPVLASVITVNLVIVAYVYQAYHEKEYDDQGEEITGETGTEKDTKQD